MKRLKVHKRMEQTSQYLGRRDTRCGIMVDWYRAVIGWTGVTCKKCLEKRRHEKT